MRTREALLLDEDLGAAMRAWRVGVEAFHFALMDKLAEDAADGTRNIRSRAAAFQAFLNARFPKKGGAA